MEKASKLLGLLALCLPSLSAGLEHPHSLYVNTEGRFGYSLTLADWVDAGVAGVLYHRGLSIWRPNPGPGGSSGSVSSQANSGLLLPILDLHPSWSGFRTGCRTYFAFHDLGLQKYEAGEWIRFDLYLAFPVAFERMELVPSAYLLQYGYSLDEKIHGFGYGILLEGMVAFRF